MKRLNFLMIAFALLLGGALTSCLNSDGNSTRTGGGMVKVSYSYTGTPVFVTLEGKTITPSASSVNSALTNGIDFSKYNGQIVHLLYSWDASTMEITEDTKDIKGVTIQSFFPMNSKVEFITEDGAANDSISDTPIISLHKEVSGNVYEPYFWGRTLILPIEYYISNEMHSFTLEYHSDKQETEGTLRFVLEHSKAKDQVGTSQTSWNAANYGALYAYYRAFDLTNILYMTGGNTPEKVVIEYKESSGIDLANAELKTYTVPYKDASK